MCKAALPFLLLAFSALAQSNPELEKANRFLFDQKFGDAAKALEAAARVQGNGREMVMRIYELQGVTYGQLGQATKAREAFQALLCLDPKRELNGKYNQKVVTAFSAAKEWANTNPPLEIKAAKAAIDDKGRVMQLAAKVRNDPMRLVKKVRFHLRSDEARWSEQDSELQGVYAAANTDAQGVEWWAELLGENDRVLMLVANEANPIREGKARDKAPASAPVVAAVPAADAPKKEEPKVAEVTLPPEKPAPNVVIDEPTAPASSGSALRPVGYVMMGAGLLTLGVGTYFGVQSSAGRDRINNAARDSQNRVTGITQKEAHALGPQSQSQAMIANVLFAAGGGVALLGGVFWIIGGVGSDQSVTLAPTAGGVTASGRF